MRSTILKEMISLIYKLTNSLPDDISHETLIKVNEFPPQAKWYNPSVLKIFPRKLRQITAPTMMSVWLNLQLKITDKTQTRDHLHTFYIYIVLYMSPECHRYVRTQGKDNILPRNLYHKSKLQTTFVRAQNRFVRAQCVSPYEGGWRVHSLDRLAEKKWEILFMNKWQKSPNFPSIIQVYIYTSGFSMSPALVIEAYWLNNAFWEEFLDDYLRSCKEKLGGKAFSAIGNRVNQDHFPPLHSQNAVISSQWNSYIFTSYDREFYGEYSAIRTG